MLKVSTKWIVVQMDSACVRVCVWVDEWIMHATLLMLPSRYIDTLRKRLNFNDASNVSYFYFGIRAKRCVYRIEKLALPFFFY